MLLNAIAKEHDDKKNKKTLLVCYEGDYAGQVHDINDWRKIALDIAKSTKNSKLNAVAKYGTDDNVIGLLYLNYGIELYDYETH